MMLNRYLVESVKIEDLDGEGENHFEVEYYLTEIEVKEDKSVNGSVLDRVYGIEILKKSQSKGNEVKHIKGIMNEKAKTINFIKKLAKNRVTPITFEYIVEDFLAIL